jgi:membrane-associated PAP2 superfamily phosphatase
MGTQNSNPGNGGRTVDLAFHGHRHAWLLEAAVFAIIAVFVTLVFAFTPLDIEAARLFYRPEAVDHWMLAKQLPWSVLYRAAPWITASLVVLGLVALAAGTLRHQILWRRQAVFLLLSVVIGPGLLINAIFKDHWDRPRPREIVAFGGPLQYVVAPLPGRESGKSFPCGHCSVGFLYGAGWWVWRRRRPTRARISLGVGLVAGVALGLGRMAAGGHFLSDVVWSLILAYAVCHLIYYHVLHLHRHEFAQSLALPPHHLHPRWHRATAIAAVLGGVAVLIALFATPHGAELKNVIPVSSLPSAPRVMIFEAKAADVEIVLLDPTESQISIEGELHGFGLPTSRLHGSVAFEREPQPTLRYRIEQTGWFTDLDGAATVLLPTAGLERVVVRLGHGNIRVRDETRSGVVRRREVQLDLVTADGHVQAPDGT